MTNMSRREFGLSLGATALAAQTPKPQSQPAKRMIGIQVGAVSFVDEGVEPVLDNFQRLAAINTLFIATFTYGRGIAGRQIPGQPLPDHGKQEYDTGYHGGNFTHIHPQYYKDTVFKDFRAPDYGDYDVLEAVLPSSHKRGLKIICWFEDVFRADLPNVARLQERDVHGNNATTLCFNNPDYRGFLLGLSEDYVRSYDVDGIMWGSERQGAFSNALSASHDGTFDASRVTCFCDFCQRKARDRGISVDRAKEGFAALEKFVRSARAGSRPVDGYYVTLWRLMLRYPELLAWEMLWTDSLRHTMFGDVPKQELLDFHYRVLDYQEGTLAQIPLTGFSSDYVYRETERARAGLAGTKALLWPGIDIDIPTAAQNSKSTPQGTKDAVLAAFRGGADGVLLSRKYSEMKLANLRGAGEAIRELGFA